MATAQIPENLPWAIFGCVLCHCSLHRTTANPIVTLSPPFTHPIASFLACRAHVAAPLPAVTKHLPPRGCCPLVELACALPLLYHTFYCYIEGCVDFLPTPSSLHLLPPAVGHGAHVTSPALKFMTV